MGDSITEGTIVDLPVAPGDFVNADDVVVVLETDKVSVDVRAQESGIILEIMGEIDDVVEVGSGLYKIDTDGKSSGGTSAPAAAAAAPAPVATPTAATPAPSAIPPPAAAPTPPPKAPAAPPKPAAAAAPAPAGQRPQ